MWKQKVRKNLYSQNDDEEATFKDVSKAKKTDTELIKAQESISKMLENGQNKVPLANQADTAYWYGILVDEDSYE